MDEEKERKKVRNSQANQVTSTLTAHAIDNDIILTHTHTTIALTHTHTHSFQCFCRFFVYDEFYPKPIPKHMLYKVKRPSFTHKQLDPFRFVDNSSHIRRRTIRIHSSLHIRLQTKRTLHTFDPESNEQAHTTNRTSERRECKQEE